MKFKNIHPFIKIVVLFSIVALFIPTAVQAGVNQWTQMNIYGGYINTLIINPQNPSILYAGTSHGLFKSTDSGINWVAVNNGLTNKDIRFLSIDPQTSNTLYAGTYSGGVFKSTDSGANWIVINNGLTNTNIQSLAIDPQMPSTLYAGTYSGGVFKSTNSGANWAAINNGLTNTNIRSLAIDPQTPSTLYAGSSRGIYKSIDNGANWIAINNGLTKMNIKYLAIDIQTTSTLYAATWDGGIFKSMNGGENWLAINSGMTAISVCSLTIDPQSPSNLYAATWEGVFKSIDSGANWFAINSGLTTLTANIITIDPQTPSNIYAGTRHGVFKSPDSAVNWSLINNGITDMYIYSLAIDPQTPSILYAGTWANGIFKSVDSGASWFKINNVLNLLINSIIIDPQTPCILYAGTEMGIFKSTDSGANWVAINNGLTSIYVRPLAIDPQTPSILYAGTWAGGVFKSIDSGMNWTAINVGLPTMDIRSLAIDPQTPSTLYAGVYDDGVFKSTDSGANWTRVDNGLAKKDIRSLAIDTQTPSTLYAGAYDGGVFKSTNSGMRWTSLNALTYEIIFSLSIDPQMPNTLYAGTLGNGIFKSIDGGNTWVAFNNGIGRLDILCFAINPQTLSVLYTGTGGFSAYQYEQKATYTISGIVTYNGAGLSGVILNGLPGNPVTNASGSYSATVIEGWDGTVMPVLNGYIFTPPGLIYSYVQTDYSGQDYSAALATYTICGTVTYNGSGLAGVTLNGLPGNPVTDASGNYFVTVSYGWGGTVTPSLTGYTFLPANLTYYNVTADQTKQDYTASLMTPTISGRVTYNGVGLAGVTLNGLPGNPMTDASGSYSATVAYGASGTVVPTMNGYAFSPDSRSYSNVTSDQTGQDYTATFMTYTISGTVIYNGSGLASVTLSGLPGNPLTDTSGSYSAIVPYGWNGTAIPILNGYIFTPASRNYNNVTSDQTMQDYTATLMTYTITGTVIYNVSSLAGVTLNGLPGNPVTDASGVYSTTVTYGWSGTATPILNGYAFEPVSRSYSDVAFNQTGQDYTATLLTYTISGKVTYNGSNLAGMTLSGLPGNPVTDTSGNYSAIVPYGWSGTATPVLNGYTFEPVNRNYSNVTSNQTSQDFMANLLTYTISGRVTYNGSSLVGVTLSGLPGNPVTNSSGNYSATVTYGWSGTATPTKNGYAFTPVSRTYNNVTSNQTGQNFTAALTYTISGRVTYNGSGLANVTLSGLPGNPVTDTSGNYSAIVPRGWSGTVRPTLSGYTFSPTRRTYSNVTSNKSNQNFSAYH